MGWEEEQTSSFFRRPPPRPQRSQVCGRRQVNRDIQLNLLLSNLVRMIPTARALAEAFGLIKHHQATLAAHGGCRRRYGTWNPFGYLSSQLANHLIFSDKRALLDSRGGGNPGCFSERRVQSTRSLEGARADCKIE